MYVCEDSPDCELTQLTGVHRENFFLAEFLTV
jgi:hypothetical protein